MHPVTKDTAGLGTLLWLIGYLASMVLYFTPVAHTMGWIITAILTPITILVAWWWFERRERLPLRYYAGVGVSWTAIAVVLDYLFIVRDRLVPGPGIRETVLYRGLTSGAIAKTGILSVIIPMILSTRMTQEIRTEGPVTKVNIGRLTNSIFIFTLLLLFQNIRTPSFGDVIDQVSPHVFGVMQVPDILNFLMVFIIIAMIWIVSFHTFHMVAPVDRTYLYLHLAMLMMLITIPVSSHYTLVFSNKSFFPILFHGGMLVLGALLFFEWYHISRTPSVLRAGITGWRTRCITIKMLILPVTAIAGLLLAACDLPYTQFIYFGAMMAFFIMSARSWKNLKKSGEGTR
ncbi:MAG: TMEM175 family protein [Methanoregula sp.]|nr:TMEM175 family protein [Methanoregula sp.]